MTDDRPAPKIEDLLAESGWIRALARQLVGDGRADDLVQEAWLVALRRAPRSPAKFRAWMAAVLRNRARDAARGESRRRRREEAVAPREPSPAPPPDAMHERLEMQRRLVEAVQRLAEPYRSTVVERFFDGRSSAEIARRGGIAEPTVRSRLQRALALLREDLDRGFGTGGKRLAGIAALCALAYPEGQAAVLASGSVGIGGVLAGATWAWKGAAAALALLGALVVGAWQFRSEPESPGGPVSAADAPAIELPGVPPEPVGGPSLSAIILDRERLEPLAGVTVSAELIAGPGAPEPIRVLASAVTDATGAVLVSAAGLASDAWVRVRAAREGYAPERWNLQLSTPRTEPVELTLSPGTRIAGRVLLPDGSPAREGWAHLRGSAASGMSQRSGEDLVPLDSEGRFVTWLPADELIVIAEVPDYRPTASGELWGSHDDLESIEIAVEEGTTARGVVLGPDGSPVQGAEISIDLPDDDPWVQLIDSRRWRAWPRLITDAAGRFERRGFPPFADEVVVRHPDLRELVVEDVSLANELRIELEAARWLVFELAPGDGTVVPVEEVQLEFALRHGRPPYQPCSVDGSRYRTAPLPAEGGAAVIHVSGFLPVAVEWPAGTGAHDLGVIALDRGAELHVRFEDTEGRPIAGQSLWIASPQRPESGRRDHESDAHGILRLSGFEPGLVRLGHPEETLVISPGINEHTIVVPVQRPSDARLRGRVVSAEMGPLAVQGGAFSGDARVGYVHSDFAAFRCEVPSGEDLLLRLEVHGYDKVERSVAALAPGEERDLGDIVLGPCRLGTIAGRVVDDRGDPVPRAKVQAGSVAGSTTLFPVGSYIGRTDREGRFSIAVLPGQYRIHPPETAGFLETHSDEPANVVIETGETEEVTIRLRRGRPFEVDLLYEDGSVPFDLRSCGISLRAEVGEWGAIENPTPDGRVRFRAVPDVPLELRVYRRSPWHPRNESPPIATGHPDQLPSEIRIPRGGDLELRVPDLPDATRFGGKLRREGSGDVGFDATVSGGRALVRDLPPGVLEVEIYAEGFERPPPQLVTVAQGKTSSLTFALAPKTRDEVTVEVVDGRGSPIVGASVSVHSGEHARSLHRTAKTSAPLGVATIELPEAPIRWLVATAEGYAPGSKELSARDASRSHRLVLDPESWVEVRVLEEDGSPVGDARIGLKFLDDEWTVDPRDRESIDHFPDHFGRDGMLRVARLPPGRYRVTVLRSNEPLAVSWVTLGPGEGKSIEMRVARNFTVRGRLTLDGEPVTVGTLWIGGPFETHFSTGPGPDGRFELVLRLPGEYSFGWDAPGTSHPLDPFLAKGHTLHLEGDQEIALEYATATPSVRFLLPDGTPLAGAPVQFDASEPPLLTDERGVAQLPSRAPGLAGWVLLAPPMGWFGRGTVELAPGATETVVTLEEAEYFIVRCTGATKEVVRLYARVGERWLEAGEALAGEPIHAWVPRQSRYFRMSTYDGKSVEAGFDRSRLESARTDPIALVPHASVYVDVRDGGEVEVGCEIEVFALDGPGAGSPVPPGFGSPPDLMPGRYRFAVRAPDGRTRAVDAVVEMPSTRVRVDLEE